MGEFEGNLRGFLTQRRVWGEFNAKAQGAQRGRKGDGLSGLAWAGYDLGR